MLTSGPPSWRTRATSQWRDLDHGWEIDGAFPKVDTHLMQSAACTVVGQGIFELETRTLLRALELPIASGLRQRRAVFLVGNMSVALSFACGRTKVYPVLAMVRRFRAICMVTSRVFVGCPVK